LYNKHADVKAVAVCPEGKDSKSDPSGLNTPANDLIEETVITINANEKTVATNICVQLLRLFIPAIFNPNIIVSGRYGRKSS